MFTDYHYYYPFTPRVFFTPALPVLFHRSLSDRKSPRISKDSFEKYLPIVTVRWSAWPSDFQFSQCFFETTPTCASYNRFYHHPHIVQFLLFFFNSLAWSKYLFIFSVSFIFTLRFSRTAKSTICQVFFFLINNWFAFRAWIRLFVYVFKISEYFMLHFSSSGVQDSFKNPCWFYLCCGLDNFNFPFI